MAPSNREGGAQETHRPSELFICESPEEISPSTLSLPLALEKEIFFFFSGALQD